VSRAARSLFLLHFKRLVVPLVGVSALLYLTSLLTLWTVKSVWHMQDDGEGLDMICLGVLLAMALPVGTAPFSKAFKEQHILFFHSLPVTRSAAWLSMVGGAFAALAVTAIGFAAVRPGAFTALSPWGAWTYAATMVTSFAIGTAAGLAFVRPVSVYVAAYLCAFLLLIGVVLGILGLALMMDDSPRNLPGLTIDTMMGAGRYAPPAAVWWIVASLSAIAFFAASHFFFVRGEMTHGRRRLLNPLALFGIVASLGLVVAPALVWAFNFRSPLDSADSTLSPDGRYALVTRRSTSVPWMARVDVVDLNTGGRTRIDAGGLIKHPVWMGDNRIGIVRRDLSWWRRPPLSTTARERLQLHSLDGQMLSQIILDEIVSQLRTRVDGAVVLGTMRGDQARVVEWRADGTLRELARAAGVNGIAVGSDAAWAVQGTGKARFWTFAGGQVRELPIRGAAEGKAPALVDGVAYASAEIAAREIERTNPAPRAAGERALYTVQGWAAESPSLFAVVPHPERRLASILVHAGGWKTISDAVPIRENEVFRAADAGLYQWDLNALKVARAWGVVAYVARAGDVDVAHFAHSRTGKDFEVARRPVGDNMVCYAAGRVGGDYIVRVYAGDDDINRRIVLEAVYRNGALIPVERRGEGSLQFLAPDGTQIRSTDLYTVSVAPPNGPVRVIDLK